MSRSEPIEIDDALLRAWPLPAPPPGSKESRGTVLVVAGSPAMPGAAILAAEATLRSGAGKLQIATCSEVSVAVGTAVCEALVIPLPSTASGAIAVEAAAGIAQRANRAQAIVIGPGLVDEAACAELLLAALPQLRTPAIIDAAALACLARPDALRPLGGNTVVTPHAGEMASVLDVEREAIEADPPRYAREAAERFGAVVVLKGETTHISQPGGKLYRYRGGHVGLATCGSGDVLAGVVGGLLARGAPPEHAAVWAVALHARAGAVLGERTGIGFLAREIAAEIPPLMRSFAAAR